MEKKVVVDLSEELLYSFQRQYENDEKNTLIRHALARHSLSNVIYEPSSVTEAPFTFSLEVKTLPVCNQKVSGRCWIFAGLNFLRERVAKKLGLKNFELSQNYISLFDKIEKANFALESLIALGQEEADSRLLHHILSSPVNDGGQWDMFVSLVNKYGVVPQSAFPETYQSNNTRETDQVVNAAIRGFMADNHPLLKEGKIEEVRKNKEELMEKIYAMFMNAFGVPPTTFDFSYENDHGYHIDPALTPLDFFAKYVGDDLNDYQSIINSPTKDKPYIKNYTVDYLGGVVGGRPINHLNLPMERMIELIIKQLRDGEPVWFGSDVGFYRDRNSYVWSTTSLDYTSTFGFPLHFSKEKMLDYWHSAMSHAMLITGVDLQNGKPTRWKIENSWGSDNGLNGYYVMTPDWFETFVYQAVVNKKYLLKVEKDACKQEPTHLNPWDPMGTLAD